MALNLYSITPPQDMVETEIITVGHGATTSAFSVNHNGWPLWGIEISWTSACSPFAAQLAWVEAEIALFGAHQQVFGMNLKNGEMLLHLTLPDGSYFCDFHIEQAVPLLLVLTSTGIYAFDDLLEQLWCNNSISIDGTVFHEFADGKVIVHSEMSSPGQWERVEVDAESGMELARTSK